MHANCYSNRMIVVVFFDEGSGFPYSLPNLIPRCGTDMCVAGRGAGGGGGCLIAWLAHLCVAPRRAGGCGYG